VPNWKRIIVGDAFRLPSRDLNYYRDSFLAWPCLIFTIAAVSSLLGGHNPLLALKFAALSVLFILLARERVLLIVSALGFCVVQSLLSFVLGHDWIALAVAISAGGLLGLLIWELRNYKRRYERPKGLSIVDLLVGLSSLGFSLVLFRSIH
jgi:hypothetical protein